MAESKTKKRLLNAVMVALCVVVVAAGAMAVANLRGIGGAPASAAGDSAVSIIAGEQTGIVNVERGGVQFSLDEGAHMRDGDAVSTLSNSRASFSVGDASSLVLGEEAEATVREGDDAGFDLRAGSAFSLPGSGAAEETGESGSSYVFTLRTDEGTVEVGAGSAVALGARTGSTSVQVLAGSVTCSGVEGRVDAGCAVSLSLAADGEVQVATSALDVAALDEFALTEAASAIDSGATLCFSRDDIASALAQRAAEKNAQQAEGSAGPSLSTAGAADAGQPSAGVGATAPGASASDQDALMSCTIEIRCDTILGNMGDLAAGKSAYVPSNGIILATSTVRFAEGDTVFDVLKAVASSTGLQLEYSYTPVYGSYYVEGINNLYEFDCGNESGWMYKVNGWYPNYGCSEYRLKDGDAIVWNYTCKGYGADLGAQVM